MSILTPFFNLFKLQRADRYAISQFNENMDTIDTEMHKPPLTVNHIEPDPTTRDLTVTTVPLADNLTTEEAQINSGTYILRTSGGEASISNGNAWLSDLKGEMVKTGYVQEELDMTVSPVSPTAENAITATIDRDTFVAEASASGTYTFTYTTGWSVDPAAYGITVSGTPASGDQIVVVYVKENRGTITTASPTSFVSTGWNLYNHAAGYARVCNYSEEYGFMIDGTYTALKFAETLDGEQQTITPVSGYFTVPSDGFVFVTGGNATDTEIWMTWSDWTEEANGGVFEAYTSSEIDLSGVMVDFPDGLMRIGNVFDEINLNTGKAYSRIQKMEYNETNLANVIASGVPYDTDTGYIYAVRIEPAVYTISLDGEYTVSDHGEEMFLGTTVPVTASSLYGNDLKSKLRRDVLTISSQELTAAQKSQVFSNLGIDYGRIKFGADAGSWTLAQLVTNIQTYATGDIILYRISPAVATAFFGASTSLNYFCVIQKGSSANAYYSVLGRGGAVCGNIALGNNAVTVYWSSDYANVSNAGSSFDDVNVTTATSVDLGSIQLAKGEYIITITVDWASNATGARQVWISDTSGGTQLNIASRVIQEAVSGSQATRMQLTVMYKPSATTTLYVIGYQNSGSTLKAQSRYSIARLR